MRHHVHRHRGFINIDAIIALMIAILFNHFIVEFIKHLYTQFFRRYSKYNNKLIHRIHKTLLGIVERNPVFIAAVYDFHNGSAYIGLKTCVYYKATPYIAAKKNYVNMMDLDTVPVILFSNLLDYETYVDTRDVFKYFQTKTNLDDLLSDLAPTCNLFEGNDSNSHYQCIVTSIEADEIIEGALVFVTSALEDVNELFEKEKAAIDFIKDSHLKIKRTKHLSVNTNLFNLL